MAFRLALGQSPADLDGPAARLDWLRDKLPGVAAEGADLLLLPELFACGYNIGAEVAARAEAVDGAFAKAVADLAHSHRLAIAYGFAERDGDAIYNAVLCIGPDGETLAHQRKLAIPPGAERAHFTPGRGCNPFAYRDLSFGILICYDAEFPEPARHLAAQGAQVLLVPTALGAAWGWVAQKMIPTRGYENGVYLAYANSAGTENGMDFLGQSVITTPFGGEAARAGADAEILFADLDPQAVSAAQTRLPYLTDRHLICLD